MKNFDKIEFYVKNIGQTNYLHGIEGSHPFELHEDEHIQMVHFLQAVSAIETKKPTMIELGHSSHSAYSQTFNNIFDGECINVCIEPVEKDVVLAQEEWTSCGFKGFFYHGYAGAKKPTNGGEKFRVKDLMLKHNIDMLDILHMDIDGQEASVLSEIAEDGIFDRIHNLFVSTHNDVPPFVDLHSECNKTLRENIKDHNYLFNNAHTGGQSDGCIIIRNRALDPSVKSFEEKIAEFFGAPYAVAVDCCTHGVELCLRYVNAKAVESPSRTYPSIPFLARKLSIPLIWREEHWQDYYEVGRGPLFGTKVYDAAVLWKENSYIPESLMCLSFQFQKHLSLGRGGMILTDDKQAAKDLKMMAHDGREPFTPWREQNIKYMGYHYYMTPETADLGLKKLPEAITREPRQWVIEDWPDLRNMEIFK